MASDLLPLLELLHHETPPLPPPPPPPSPPPPSSSSSSSSSSSKKTISDPPVQRSLLRLSGLLADLPYQLQHQKLRDEQERRLQDDDGGEYGASEEFIARSSERSDESGEGVIGSRSRDSSEVSSSSRSKISEINGQRSSRLWSSSQLDAVLDITEAFVSQYRNLQTEDGITEPTEGVFCNTVESCVQAFKNLKSLMNPRKYLTLLEDKVYNRLLLLMELAVDAEKLPSSPYLRVDFTKEILEDLDTGQIVDVSSSKHFLKHASPETVEISEDIMRLLANDQALEHGEINFLKHNRGNTNILLATQYYASTHPYVSTELIDFCVALLVNFNLQSHDDVEKQAQIRLSLISRILRLVCSLQKTATRSSSSEGVLKGIVELTALVPEVLRYRFTLDSEYVGNPNNCYVAFLSSIIAISDIVYLDSCISQNLKVYLAAAAIECLLVDDLFIDKKATHKCGPVILEPHVISHIFSLIRTVIKLGGHHSLGSGDSMAAFEGLSLHLWSQKFEITSKKNQNEVIELIFPSNMLWLPKLLKALNLVYQMGMEVRPSADKSMLSKREDVNEGPSETLAGTSEDEALFGNLFSESSRQTSFNGSHVQLSIVENKVPLHQNMASQEIIEFLVFLKDCVFSLDAQECLCLSTQKQLNEECIDIILEIFMSNLYENTDSLASGRDAVCQVSFDVLNLIISGQLSSASLKQHFLSRILEKGYAGCTIPNKTLVLLAKVLINHSYDSKEDDSLSLALWSSFLDRVESNFQRISWSESPLLRSNENIPSTFFIEVLLMCFHSSKKCTRIAIIEKVRCIVEHLCREPQTEMSSSFLCLHSLLFSRVLIILRYMSLHFETFPHWFLIDLKLNLSQFKEHGQKIGADTYSTTSIATILGQGLKDTCTASQQASFNDYVLACLFDINPFCSGDQLSKEVLQSLESVELCSKIRKFIQRWTGKTVNEVEELLVERYVFLLSWLIVRDFGKRTQWTLPVLTNGGANGLFGADVNLMLTQNLYGFFSWCKEKNCEIDASDWWRVFMQALNSFEAFAQDNNNTKFALIDSLRQVSVLNIFLSFIHKGLEVFLIDQGLLSLPECEDDSVQVFCLQLVYNCVSTGSLDLLLKALSSILSFYVNSFHCSVLEILVDSQVCKASPSSIYLILRGGLSWSKQDQIFTKLGVSFSPLHMLLRRGMPASWFAEMMSKCAAFGKMSMLDKVFLPSLLQGYPCSHHPNSALVLACVTLIKCILETVELLLKVNSSSSLCNEEKWEENVLFTILVELLMMIISEEIFESIHSKCEDVLSVLIPSEEKRSSIQDLHLLKQKESLLKSIAGDNELSSAVREELILHVVEIFCNIHSDPARNNVFKQYFTLGSGQLSYLIDVLDGCHQETVNVKTLQFLVSVVENESVAEGGIRCRFVKKLMAMDAPVLCSFLEQKLLGCSSKSAEGSVVFSVVSSSIRDPALGFLSGLIVFDSTVNAQGLQSHLLNALLLSLERAFNHLDNMSLRSYFTLLLQLANGEQQCRQILQSVSLLMSKLPCQDGRIEGLKVLVVFLSSLLQLHGDQQSQILPKVIECKHWHTSLRDKTKHSFQKKPIDISCLNQGGEPVTGECDAGSVDEDEDDGTSDGEMITSFDKEEIDDETNTEKALALRVCTFTSSGNNFMEQHWYFCYTCDLTVSKGCCSVCARVCHRGHKVVYSRFSRFFCDCGAGSVRGQSCMCLKPRKFVSSSNASSIDQEPPSDSDSELEDDDWADSDRLCKLSSSEGEEPRILPVFMEMDIEGQVLSLCERLLLSLNGKRHSMPSIQTEIRLGEQKRLNFKSDFLHLGRLYKSGSFDMKIKADYVNAKELKAQLLNGTMFKSILSINSRGKLAVGEGDKVSIFDIEQVIGKPSTAPVTVDKTSIKVLSKSHVRFELVHIVFNAANENYVAVAGYEDCQIFTINGRGEVIDRLAVDLALQGAHIRRVIWIPQSQVQIMVVTNKFVKVYDLSQDNISPLHYFTILEDDIVDATLVSLGQERLILIVLSQQGVIYTHRINSGASQGACILTDTLILPETFKSERGLSLHYSSVLRVLFLSYSNGLSLIAHLDADGTSLTDISSIIEVDQDMKSNAAELHSWRELADIGQGLFICLSKQRANSAVAVSLGPSEIQGQYMRVTGNLNSPRIDGVAAHRSLLKGKYDVLILHDDGSLQVFTYGPGGDASPSGDVKVPRLEAEQVKKLGEAILGSRAGNPLTPIFPIDFFERTSCITSEIRLSGDILRSLDSEGAKLNLASEDGFLESPSPSGFKIVVHNPNADTVMVGCRVHVGNSGTSQVPTELRIFQRSVKLEEGVRRWYDLPFTNVEALLAEEEFSLFVGPTFGGFSAPRIESLEVYGRSKDDFGWKEKLEAILDMEVPGFVSDKIGDGGKNVTKNASMEEQVIADCFMLLSSYYLTIRMKSARASLEASSKRCKPLLELAFESDTQPLLQEAARNCLRALYPAKDSFYQAMDTLRLTSISRVCPLLVPKVRLGGSALPGLIQEFTALLRAACKIALHRRGNFISFLECHGASLIEDLMGLLWELLTVENPDAETVNSLVLPSVDLIYGYAECLSLCAQNESRTLMSVAPAVALIKKLLFFPNEAVRASCSLAMSSRLLQVPFPKRTILASDEVGDTSKQISLPVENSAVTGGPDGQSMIEEDGGNSSVQYCCDGCGTVPIVGRRWHCNVCPDFDLCEACYELMDGDSPPAPHSRDHSMSAVPIEFESAGAADGPRMHFASIDELSDENPQLANEVNTESNSANLRSTQGISEMNDTLSMRSEIKNVPISASKRALNTLLLKGLVDECRGWAKCTSGTEAVPLMQFFYRLASAATSPFMEIVDTECISLESFVRLLMEELNLEIPLSVKPRSNFGEVVIIIFTFFNLMLRNWHQPGADHSNSKNTSKSDASQTVAASQTVSSHSEEAQHKADACGQLDRACASLRQNLLLNYILSILQQLTHVFKSRNQESYAVNSGGPVCGALLTVKKEFVAGNFAPYFTDSYAKAHRNDLFGEFHRLLLESAFRLAYNLVRPEKQGEKDQANSKLWQDLNRDDWQEVLCSYINNPHTASIRRFARRLLLHLCGSKGNYYHVRDAWQLSKEVKKLFKLVQKAGGFQALLSYERSVKLVKCLSTIVEVGAARPRNWQKYCSKHPDVIQFLLNGIFVYGEESVLQTLKLLSLAFYAGKEYGTSSKKGEPGEVVNGTAINEAKQSSQATDVRKKKKGSSEDTTDSTADKPFLDMELVVEQFATDDGKILLQFINVFLIEWNAACVRTEAKTVLIGAWYHGRPIIREIILRKLLQKVPVLPSYGQNINEYTDLLTWILGKGIVGSTATNEERSVVQSCLNSDMVKVLFDMLRSQNELLANHPNSRIYNTLSSLVEFDSYYLESEPCLTCSCPEAPYSRMKLDSLKSETKFTDNRILVKCVGSHTIESVTMNVHDARRSKSVKVLNLYYNNKPVTDLSELKNNWSMWKRAKSCHLAFNQTELKVDFPIPITACNFMIELDSFYESLQASSLESLQCPRCSRYVTDKHGICGHCHENAYQCRQCRNINYENLDSFLCNECGYSKYGRFEFNFMAKPSFHFENIENDEDMKKVLAAIEVESENAHKRYQQLLGFKKPLLKLVSSIGETEIDSQQKDSVQQMIVSLPGSSSFKINRKIAILGVLYGEKCKMAFDSVSRSVQNLQGLRRILTSYLEQKRSPGSVSLSSKLFPSRPPNHCYGCANTFVGQCLEWLQVLAKLPSGRQQLVSRGIVSELFENNIHQGSKKARTQARSVLCAITEGDGAAVAELNMLIKQKSMYCLDHHRSIDVATCIRDELQLLSETCALSDDFWESRLRLVFELLFSSVKAGARHPVIAEHIILPCLRIISQVCTPPKAEVAAPESDNTPVRQKSQSGTEGNDDVASPMSNKHSTIISKGPLSVEKGSEEEYQGIDVPLVSYEEWKHGATYVDFVRRQYIASQVAKPPSQKVRRDPKRADFLALKYFLRWKRAVCKRSVRSELSAFEDSSWVRELALSACSPAIRIEMCGLIEVLCSQSAARRSIFLNLLMTLLPSTRTAGEGASEYFELLFKMVEPEDARLFLTVRGFLQTLCRVITEEVSHIESQEHTFHVDISQGYILHKLIELLGKFLQVPNIRIRFIKDGLLSQVLESFLVVRSLVVQKTKLISDCGHLLKDLLDGLLEESFENKRHFIYACINGLQSHVKDKKDSTLMRYILELLCNIICPTKPEPAYMMVLNKAHTQEEFIRGSMTKNPYSSLEIGPLMRDVRNKICHQLDMVGLIEDDCGMELLVAGNIISLDLSVSQVYEQVWRKSQSHPTGMTPAGTSGGTSLKECSPMAVTYRLQGVDGEATEPIIKELEDDREESQDPEVEFAIAGVMRECNGLDIILNMVQALSDDDIRSGQDELTLLLKLLMYCCKIRGNRLVLLQLGALGVLIERARRAFTLDASETAEGLLLIVEYLVTEANESDIGIGKSSLNMSEALEGAGGQAAHVVHMFLERLSSSSGLKKSTRQQRNNDTVARILPYLTYGEEAAMEILVKYFDPHLHDWASFDQLYLEVASDEALAHKVRGQNLALENFCKVVESIKGDAQGDRLKGLIMKKGIVTECINHLKAVFSVFDKSGDYKSTAEWINGLQKPSVPIILEILRGLSSGHFATQMCLSQQRILPLLHALEGASGDNKIGAKAENLLDTLANKDGKGEGFLADDVMKLRHATRDEMRKRALQKREELLQGLGMHRELTSAGERIRVSRPSIEGLEDVQEEAGLACMVCREGYSLCPTDMLGAYCYSKRLNLGGGIGSGAQSEWVYTTVSHFNVIHFKCHLEAKRADASLKNPKKEWEGAAIRNNETLCNNLFPLRGPSMPLVQYARYVDQYWDTLNALGRADGSRTRLLTYDIVLMLARFAMGASFSTDSKGGGKESNSRLLPFMLQMACHLLDQGGIGQKRGLAKSLSSYVSSSSSLSESPSKLSTSSSPQRFGAVDDTAQFMMVQSLLLESFDDWQKHRQILLQRSICHAYLQHKSGRMPLATSPLPSSPSAQPSMESTSAVSETRSMEKITEFSSVDKGQLFSIVRPMLSYCGLIDQLQRYFKSGTMRSKLKESASQVEGQEGALVHGGLESWEIKMRERLHDIQAMLALSKELLEWLDDMQTAADLQEAFDVMGDPLPSNAACEDFILSTVSTVT